MKCTRCGEEIIFTTVANYISPKTAVCGRCADEMLAEDSGEEQDERD